MKKKIIKIHAQTHAHGVLIDLNPIHYKVQSNADMHDVTWYNSVIQTEVITHYCFANGV